MSADVVLAFVLAAGAVVVVVGWIAERSGLPGAALLKIRLPVAIQR